MKKFLCSLPALIVLISSASGTVILSTDFTGRTVSGDVASTITYVTTGVTNPGNLTAIEAAPGDNQLDGLFDTANAQGYFAPALNTGNEDNWSTDINFSLTASTISIASVDLAGAMFDGNGNFQSKLRGTDFTVSFIGSLSGNVGSQTITVDSPGSGGEAGAAWSTVFDNFGSPVTLTDAESWTLRIATTTSPLSGQGNNTAISGFTLNGTIPEPSTALLSSLALIGLLRRKR